MLQTGPGRVEAAAEEAVEAEADQGALLLHGRQGRLMLLAQLPSQTDRFVGGQNISTARCQSRMTGNRRKRA